MTLLYSENPLVVNPELAVAVGLNEAIILQQVAYWLKTSKHCHNGMRWVYNSISSWAKQFPFFSESTIKRAILSLENKGILISGNYNKDPRDKTKWYTINFDVMKELSEKYVNDASGQNDLMEQVKVTRSDRVKMTLPLPETNTETTTEINNITPQPKVVTKNNQLDLGVFVKQPSHDIWRDFLQHRKNKRAKLTQTALNRLARQVNIACENGYSTDEVLAIIQERGWTGFEYQWLLNQSGQIKSSKSLDCSVNIEKALTPNEWGLL